MLVYEFTGTLAFLAPGMTAELFALLLIFFIVNASASRRLMITLAAYEGLLLGAALLSLGPGSLARRTATVAISLAALLALINLWGALFARGRDREEE